MTERPEWWTRLQRINVQFKELSEAFEDNKLLEAYGEPQGIVIKRRLKELQEFEAQEPRK